MTDSMLSTGSAAAQRWLGFAGAVLAAASVALSAYASHAANGAGQASLQAAAAIAFGHGIALAALSHLARRRLANIALVAMLLGTLLFSGGLVVAHVAGVPARTAPFGGSLLIAAWLAWALDALRR
ncbi:DUF423 domain-containing protein [Luteimonas sp. 22616]|uniref:DUF423 domain-containing protein n=1 Tax=Luteimonas sp. 22616 TaxID=3453951 RepID=UPI003F8296D3